jgi:hypothetical protein
MHRYRPDAGDILPHIAVERLMASNVYIEQAAVEGVLEVPRSLKVSLLDSEEDGAVFRFAYTAEDGFVHRDPFEAANEFLDARSSRALLKVFRKYGPLTNSRFPTKQISLSVVVQYQSFWRRFRDGSISFEKISILDKGLRSNTAGAEEWTTRLPVLQPIWGEPLILEAQCDDLLHALNLALFADKLLSIERLYCRLESCRAAFTRKKGEQRFFCTTEHGSQFHKAKYKLSHKAEIAERRRVKVPTKYSARNTK